MIPKIIHSCWFGKGPKPELVERCMCSWHTFMPCVCDSESQWTYMDWSEDNFDISAAPLYVQQAYEAKKYAFVSDFVRLWALEQYGGLYMDVDFEVYQSFEPLLNNPAFAGWQGSKRLPVMMGVMASEPHNPWIKAMLRSYDNRTFIKTPLTSLRENRGEVSYDMTPNTEYFTDWMISQGLVCDGVEKDWCPIGETSPWVHIYPVDYFCPGLTTGENIRSEHTYCEHKGLHSWSGNGGWKAKLLAIVSPAMKAKIIKLKRKLLG